MTTDSRGSTSRRAFLKALGILAVSGRTLLETRDARAAVYAAKGAAGREATWPEMPRRTLGRTGFDASRLVFGCGAALARRPNDPLLEAALDAGINVFDNGTRRYYGDAEVNLAPFMSRHRDEVFLISKAMDYLEKEPDDAVSAAEARAGAQTWTSLLEASLGELGVERVDAYYLMAANNAAMVASEEFLAAAERAKQAGKISHLGLSSHQNQKRVLDAAMETGAYDLAQIAITPAGWYDWESRGISTDTEPMVSLQAYLSKVRASGIGLVGMKAGRYLAGRKFLGWGKPDAFDEHYDPKLMASGLSPFQRSYAFVLEHGLDAVNADMQSFAHLEENAVAAASAPTHFA